MPSLDRAYQWAINTCNAPNIGYSQDYRNQKTVNKITYYDCSSFIWYALISGEFDVKSAYRQVMGYEYSNNAIVTTYERNWLLALGFVEVPITGEWKKGDILWRKGHTEMVYSGGIGQGVTMGAHSSNRKLADQVSINGYTSTSGAWTSLYRYGEGGAQGYGSSLYVISAICGNFWQESTMNPKLWEDRTPKDNFSILNVGYGLGQWSNTQGDTHGRLYQFHEYFVENLYPLGSGNAQLTYLIHENYWLHKSEYPEFTNLESFLKSNSTDLERLTHAWNWCWEGIHDASWNARVTYAQKCYDYILAHANDTSITEWKLSDTYLSEKDMLNNAVMLYRFFSTGGGGGTRTRGGMPIWMMIRRL